MKLEAWYQTFKRDIGKTMSIVFNYNKEILVTSTIGKNHAIETFFNDSIAKRVLHIICHMSFFTAQVASFIGAIGLRDFEID